MLAVTVREIQPKEQEILFALRYKVFVGVKGDHNFPGYVARYGAQQRIPNDGEGRWIDYGAFDEKGDLVGANSVHCNGAWILTQPWVTKLEQALRVTIRSPEVIAECTRCFVLPEKRLTAPHAALMLLQAVEERFVREGGLVLFTAVREKNRLVHLGLRHLGWIHFETEGEDERFVLLAKLVKKGG